MAQVLDAQFPELVATQPELLAHHLTEAGHHAQAVGYWQRAGESAVARSAHLEAISHLTKGLAGLQTLPETAERTQQELLLQTTLGPALMITKGFAAPEVEHAYARARVLCQQVGETPQRFAVLRGLWQFYNGRGGTRRCASWGSSVCSWRNRGTTRGAYWRPTTRCGPPGSCSASCPSRARTWSRAWRSTTPSSTARWPSWDPDGPGASGAYAVGPLSAL